MSTTEDDARSYLNTSDEKQNINSDQTITLTKRNGKFTSIRKHWYRNDLLALVGYLEFFNALDFPANVWNDIPVRTFAKGLMISFGAVILLSSSIAILDFRRSLRHVSNLRNERRYLVDKLKHVERESQFGMELQAWLSLNFRELGWEIMDRLLMDVLVGFASILVGTGTIMAVDGANSRIYRASNLLSGYIGNSLVAFYGLLNSFWSTYLFVRAKRHKKLVGEFVKDQSIKDRSDQVFRNHQKYALLNGITLLVSGAGSLISSTMWWGYVILIPCIGLSVYCNQLWRKQIGYSRVYFPYRSSSTMDISTRLRLTFTLEEQLKQVTTEAKGKLFFKESLSPLMHDNEILESLAVHLSNSDNHSENHVKPGSSVFRIQRKCLENIDLTDLPTQVQRSIIMSNGVITLNMQRMLFELLGAFLTIERNNLHLQGDFEHGNVAIKEGTFGTEDLTKAETVEATPPHMQEKCEQQEERPG